MHVVFSWLLLLRQTASFVRPTLPSTAAVRLSAKLGPEGLAELQTRLDEAQAVLGEGVVGVIPIDAAPSTQRLIGEGVLFDAAPDATPLNTGSLFVLAALAFAGLALFVARNFEPNPDARVSLGLDAAPPAIFAEKAYYVVRWRARRDLVYESLDSVAARAAAGADVSERCTSLLEANALIRRLAKADSGVVARTYKVTGASVVELEIGEGGGAADAEDAWVGDFSQAVAGVVSPDAPPRRRQASDAVAGTAPVSSDADRQAIWDDLLQEEAEAEARAARSDVDDQWSAYLETLKVTKGEIDAVVIGGVDGPAPCRLCNGKGFRVMFKKETPCEWCGGRGYEEE